MLNSIEYLDDGEKQYPIAFTLNVMEAIQQKYGTLQEWGKLAQSRNEPDIAALKYMLMESQHEGVEMTCKCKRGMCECDYLTLKEVGRLITRIGIKTVAEKISKLITASLEQGDSSKNAKPTKNQKA